MSFKLSVNDIVVEVDNMEFFKKGIILPKEPLYDIEKLKELDRKHIEAVNEKDKEIMNPTILLPLNNGLLIAKGILYFKDHDLYGIPEKYDNFIFFSKNEPYTFLPKIKLNNYDAEPLGYDTDFLEFEFDGFIMDKQNPKEIRFLPGLDGFRIIHKKGGHLELDNNELIKFDSTPIKTAIEIKLSDFVTRKILNMWCEAFLETFTK